MSQPKDAKKIPCNTPGAGYQIDCKGCQENGLQTAYIGETGRPAVNRGIEHIKAIQSKKENHPIVKHLKQTHNNSQKRVTFEFALTGKFKSPLARQAGYQDQPRTSISLIPKQNLIEPLLQELK